MRGIIRLTQGCLHAHAQSSGVLDDPGVVREWTFKSAAAAPSASPSSSSSSFDPGAAIPAALLSADGATLTAAYGGSWGVPGAVGAADGGGAASPAGPCDFSGSGDLVRFGLSMAPRQCSVTAPLTPALCSTLSADRFVSRLRVGVSPQASPASPGSYVTPLLTAAYIVTPGAEGRGATVAAALNATDAAAASGAWSSSGGACACGSAVTGVTYAVAYSAATLAITGVSAQLFLTTLSGSGQAACGGSEPLSVPFTALVRCPPPPQQPLPPCLLTLLRAPSGLGRVRPGCRLRRSHGALPLIVERGALQPQRQPR